RKKMIISKAVPQLVPFQTDLGSIHHSVYVEWQTLVEQPRPLTDSTWKALRPKLRKLFDESDYCNFADEDATIQRTCSERLLELLIDVGGEHTLFKAIATSLDVGTVPTSAPVASTNRIYELMLTPYPNLNDALEWGCMEEFKYTPSGPDETELLFGQVADMVGAEVSKWREGRMVELRQLALASISASRGDEHNIKLTVKGSTEPTQDLHPVARRLLRADCIFKASRTHPLHSTLCLGSSYPVALPLFFPDLLVTRRDAVWNVAYFEAHLDARRVARALLKCLGMEDAAHVEMKVMGSRFVCGRCVDCEARDWSGIIGHYLGQQQKQKYAREQSVVAEARRHDLQRADEPLVKIVPAEDAGKTPDLSVFVPPKKYTRGIRGYRKRFF
ncbi:hypothetical protein FS749_002598, partial [Ceratobasidium sp. UAMH 11750]